MYLADGGRAQADAAATRIAALKKVDAVYASPLERTKETAAPIAKARGPRVRTDRGLLECDFGSWTGAQLKDLRKTCAPYHDEHVPESLVEILGHSVGGIIYRHYAHRAPLAFRAITTLPQPAASQAPVKGSSSKSPCCQRRYADAG